MTLSPPEYELRPETRARQRAELIAIVSREHATTPRRRLVPLVAAAAVVAITAGLAIGLPALRNDHDQPLVSGTNDKSEAATVEPLNDADKTRLGKSCHEHTRFPRAKSRPEAFTVIDGFSFAKPPGDAFITTWTVIRDSTLGMWTVCGMDSEGKVLQALAYGKDQIQYRPVENRMVGAGSYAAHISRITIAVGNQEPVDAVLRHGFFYAPVPYLRVRGPHTDATRLPYLVRGYDAAGRLVYTSPRNDGEWRAQGNTCYVDGNGKLVVRMTDNPHPDPKTCLRSFTWNYLPR